MDECWICFVKTPFQCTISQKFSLLQLSTLWIKIGYFCNHYDLIHDGICTKNLICYDFGNFKKCFPPVLLFSPKNIVNSIITAALNCNQIIMITWLIFEKICCFYTTLLQRYYKIMLLLQKMLFKGTLMQILKPTYFFVFI